MNWYEYQPKAVAILNSAVNSGRIKRQPCQTCGANEHIEAHHLDYDKPLEVIWLCRACHKALHREIRHRERKAAQPAAKKMEE